jgi:hypothetical protein
VLVFADESAWGGDKKAQNKLKGLVTENQVLINRKYLTAISEPSALHIIIASNSDWPVIVEHDDRRYCILRVNETRKQDRDYFNLLNVELDHGGRAAMLHELQQWPVDWDALMDPPDTVQKAELKERSLSFVQRWMQGFSAR